MMWNLSTDLRHMNVKMMTHTIMVCSINILYIYDLIRIYSICYKFGPFVIALLQLEFYERLSYYWLSNTPYIHIHNIERGVLHASGECVDEQSVGEYEPQMSKSEVLISEDDEDKSALPDLKVSGKR